MGRRVVGSMYPLIQNKLLNFSSLVTELYLLWFRLIGSVDHSFIFKVFSTNHCSLTVVLVPYLPANCEGSDKRADYSFSVASLSALADLGKLVGLNSVLETCSLLSPTRLKKCHLLENYGIYGGHLFNGTVIYVGIVKVFREYFEN